MKIYIHTDLEGISGIDRDDMILRDAPDRQYCCERLMCDLNAAIDGAIAGGATHVTVLDAHGGGHNFIVDLLDKRADLDTRENKKWWGKLDETYDGTFFIGAHAMAGTLNGFLDHTQSSTSWFNYSINGRNMGELAQWATVAGNYNVPMLMVSGDEAACCEARQFFSPLECATVKRGVGRNKAVLEDLHEATARIREAARKAISLIGAAQPFKPLIPMELKLVVYRSDYADRMSKYPGIERLDARTIRKTTSSYNDILF